MEKIKYSDLAGTGWCRVRKGKGLDLSSGLSDAARRSVFVKSLVKRAMAGEAVDFAGETMGYFKTLGAETEEGLRLSAGMAARQAERYVSCETRKANPAGPAEIDLFGFPARAEPDFFFVGDREAESTVLMGGKRQKTVRKEPYIEIVRLETGKPSVSVRGRKRDAGVMTSLKLYALLRYGKELAERLLEDGTEITVGASFYYLRKGTDRDDYFNPQFFQVEKGERPNFVTLWDKAVAGDASPTKIDAAYRSLFLSYLEGEDMHGCDGCRCCEYRPSCYYHDDPRPAGAGLPTAKVLAGMAPTPAQAEAVMFRRGTARINAGAGSGKTFVVALRAALLAAEGCDPAGIAILTFTKAGAAEFRERAASYAAELGCGADLSAMTAATFNSLGDRIVRENHGLLGFAREPRLMDDVERLSMIAGVLRDSAVEGLDYRNFALDLPSAKGALAVASAAFEAFRRRGARDAGEAAEAAREALGGKPALSDRAAEGLFGLYLEYREAIREACLIEYADQELFALELMERHPELRGGFRHVIVDEFQDTNAVQARMLDMLTGTDAFESLMVVGDDSQAIYGFRGSTPEFIIGFGREPGRECRDFYLLENHRSTPEIIRFANRINALNERRVEKDLVATRPHGAPVAVRRFGSQEAAEAFMAAAVKAERAAGTPYGDIAYIAYTRAELLRAKALLDGEGVPCAVMAPEPYLENGRTAAALAFASLMDDPSSSKDAYAYLVARTRGRIDGMPAAEAEEAVRRVREAARGNAGSEEFFTGSLKALLEGEGGRAERDETFESFLSALDGKDGLGGKLRYCRDFLKYGERQCAAKALEYPGVALVTAHSSKGKEWPVVISSLSKYDAQGMSDGETEERRRLLFVSATRARDRLYVIGKKVAFGSVERGTASDNRFLAEAEEAAG